MMQSVARIVIIHGSFGKPEGNWFPWLAGELRKDGHEVLVPRLPTPEGQNLSNWHKTFANQVGSIDESSILVGHSLAPGFILNLLEASTAPVIATFLVAGFLGNLGIDELDAVNETFVCRPFDWDKIRKNAGHLKIYNSDDDPYVPLQKGYELAEKLAAQLDVIHGAGHINADSGFVQFPQLLSDLRDVLHESPIQRLK